MGQTRGRIRIIAGQLRGRRIPVANAEDLRPTPDRVRETLFNWLQPVIAGARCLDLFAGSGALGLEAASRGAAHVTWVERDAGIAKILTETVARMVPAMRENIQTDVIVADAMDYLKTRARAFDIIFVDPPYKLPLLAPCCQQLGHGWVGGSQGRIYLELAQQQALPRLPATWSLRKHGHTKQIAYYLFYNEAPSGE